MADSVATIRSDIYAVLTTLDASSNIGLVHDYERWALHWEQVLDVLRDPTDGVIRSWMIGYRGFTNETPPSFFSQVEPTSKSLSIRSHRWVVRGVRAVDDTNESEKGFLLVTQTVANALDGATALHDEVKYWGSPPMTPVDLEAYDVRSFAGVLCHVAELVFSVSAVHVGEQPT